MNQDIRLQEGDAAQIEARLDRHVQVVGQAALKAPVELALADLMAVVLGLRGNEFALPQLEPRFIVKQACILEREDLRHGEGAAVPAFIGAGDGRNGRARSIPRIGAAAAGRDAQAYRT